ncbi:MAG: tRNA threonylcarbamoyladenosine dehydratase [Eubacteriales bacterium]|nr:tRNA threonylcarbamoyladenosine dehydratase [Eubacteriales bacterium]
MGSAEVERFSRSRMLLGGEAMERLSAARVAVFGIGGVGGYVVEALARSGVGALDLIDNDRVALSNLNRQIIATMDTIGRDKVEVMAERVRSINPSVRVTTHKCFYLPETADRFDFTDYDYVVDAIDTVTGKIQLVLQAKAAGVPIISAMGAGNKLDPTRFAVADIYETRVDPLARVMRRELKKRGVSSLKVVYSTEKPLAPAPEGAAAEEGAAPRLSLAPDTISLPEDAAAEESAAPLPEEYRADGQYQKETCAPDAGNEKAEYDAGTSRRRAVPGSLAFVPSVAGLIIAGEVVRDLAGPGIKTHPVS